MEKIQNLSFGLLGKIESISKSRRRRRQAVTAPLVIAQDVVKLQVGTVVK